MLIFTPLQYLILTFSGVILFAYQDHYNNSLVYSTGKRRYISTVSFGFAAVGAALGLQLNLQRIGLEETILTNSFIYSALVEELIKISFILLVLWYNKITEVLYDGIFYGVILGGTFGFVENLMYTTSLPFWSMMLRAITSSALHLLNGGIAGYFCMKFLFTKGNYKYKYIIEGFALCYITHGIYNFAGFVGGMFLVLLPLVLVYNFMLVEFISAYSKSCLPKFTLDLINLSIQDYELIRRYTKYELWLQNEQRLEKKYIHLFQTVSNKRKLFTFLTFMIGCSFILLDVFFSELRTVLFKEILFYEYMSIFIIYPIVISISIFSAGIINPEFFQKQILRVPFISVVDVKCKDYQETAIVFFLSTYGFYAPFMNPEKLQGELELNFLIGNKEFKHLKGRTIWINENRNETITVKSSLSVSGALIRFNNYPIYLVHYWKWARWTHRFTNFRKSIESIQ